MSVRSIRSVDDSISYVFLLLFYVAIFLTFALVIHSCLDPPLIPIPARCP